MGKNIPERAIKWFAAITFVAFGLIALYDVAPLSLKTIPVVAACAILSLLLLFLVARLAGGNNPKTGC
ncbi:MAG: hypothetical protein A4E57_00295 [Syntrophorhabdaceae bacterium PtaU1.Bin034]|jgi:hypothetical protein|nr:MAG: hypothetical protein A4E57_00295 [Syntrophorhabdaceae bacterium PtaU1.Bin034]